MTEGRVFTRQVIRDAQQRERAGAGVLSPGTSTWDAALSALGERMVGVGPVHAGKRFAEALARLKTGMIDHNACYLNFCYARKRSGMFQVLTFEAAKHPLVNKEGIMVASYAARLQGRSGCASVIGRPVTFVPEHLLGRLYERSTASVKETADILGVLGLAGYLMQRSEKHRDTSVSVSFEQDVLIVGVLRDKGRFLDCLTVVSGDNPEHARQFEQGCYVAAATMKYMDSDSSDPRGYADRVPVLPHTYNDYVTDQLKREHESKK